ncbi:MAG TPA: SulP family inorganic anion transporter [Anaerolineaceae bacterium]|nr:SulP family inorganic anion transporter [Anaerolineaceae bacterium]
MQRRARSYFNHHFQHDLQAALTVVLIAIPQSMAYALIAGINPLYGLVGVIIPAIIAPLFGSSSYLVTGLSNAIAITTAGVLIGYTGTSNYLEMVFTLAIISGIVKLLLGLLKLGWITRIISNSVLTGFLMGLGLLIIVNQLSPLTGIPRPSATNAIFTLADELTNLNLVNFYVLGLALATMILLLTMRKINRRFPAEMLVIILASLFVYLIGWRENGVRVIADLGDFPKYGLQLFIPNFSIDDWKFLIPGGLAVALMSMVEALTVSKSVALSKGQHLDVSKELVGQGIASLVGGLLQAPPSSGSTARTAVNIGSGARTRIAALMSGLLIIPAAIWLRDLIQFIPLTALGAVVVVSATRIVNWKHVRLTWNSRGSSRWVMVVTFLATQIFPLQIAIFMGIGISLIFYLYESSQLQVRYISYEKDGAFYENEELRFWQENKPIVVMSIEGPLHFAAVDVFEKHLDQALEAGSQVVIIRLRSAQIVASTALAVLAAEIRHAQMMDARIVLCGLDQELCQHLRDSGILEMLGEEAVFVGDRRIFQATQKAITFAENLVKL